MKIHQIVIYILITILAGLIIWQGYKIKSLQDDVQNVKEVLDRAGFEDLNL